jgi:heme A synthase
MIAVQVAIGAATVLMGLPRGLQAAHVAVGTAVWAGVVLTAINAQAPEVLRPGPVSYEQR